MDKRTKGPWRLSQHRAMRAAALRVIREGGHQLDARGAAIYASGTAGMFPKDWYAVNREAGRCADWATKRYAVHVDMMRAAKAK